MQKGTLQPEQIRLYTEPVAAPLHYVKIQKDPFPTPQEAQVWFQLNGVRRTAFVPLDIVDEERGAVTATLLGEFNGKIVVSFPPTNFGQTRFSAYEEDLERIAVENRHDGE
jgi:hypothetical protein